MNKEYPIIFSTDMIRAIFEGRKTMTRRVVKPIEYWAGIPCYQPKEDISINLRDHLDICANYCPYGKVGDRLWVRETFYPSLISSQECIIYNATPETKYARRCDEEWFKKHWSLRKKLIPSIHMPRWASRIILEITNIRVEKLQEISKADCIKEGLKPYKKNPTLVISHWSEADASELILRKDFMFLWNSLHKKEYYWEKNVWVWVISFKRVKNG